MVRCLGRWTTAFNILVGLRKIHLNSILYILHDIPTILLFYFLKRKRNSLLATNVLGVKRLGH